MVTTDIKLSSDKLPKAVLLGGAYEDGTIRKMQDACHGAKLAAGIKWFRPDLNISTPPLGPAYGIHMVKRFKEAFESANGSKEKEGNLVWY
jgi:hypothetical protein